MYFNYLEKSRPGSYGGYKTRDKSSGDENRDDSFRKFRKL